jgi:purine catabolism regulator
LASPLRRFNQPIAKEASGRLYDRLAPARQSVYSQHVAVTIAELVADPHLRLRFIAGASGGARVVTWAHTSDLPDPTQWLGTGELLMSNGLTLSADPDAQVAFLERLAAVGLSGLAIGDDVHAPPLSALLRSRADDLDFPLLAIPHEVPFVAVSRAVANANTDDEHKRLVGTLQLYEVLRAAVSRGGLGAQLLRELEKRLGCTLALLDTRTGLPVLPSDDPPPPGLAELIAAELSARNGAFPGVLRVEHEGSVACAVRVSADREVALVALGNGSPVPELCLLQHAANIAALEVERVSAERRHTWQLGSELMARLLERRIDTGSAAAQLREQGLDPERVVLATFRPAAPEADERELHHALAARGLVHVLHGDGTHVLAALPDGDEALSDLLAALAPQTALGVSDPLRRVDRVPDAAREARWAEAAARSLGGGLARYGNATPLFLPRTLGEAETAADRILGPVMTYDREHGTELVHSLRVFLDENRSWTRSAELLHVHKQTLVYRMRRVEELTGRNLREMADVVQLWLGLRALDFAATDAASQADVSESAGVPQ